jgi:hypothetical protein
MSLAHVLDHAVEFRACGDGTGFPSGIDDRVLPTAHLAVIPQLAFLAVQSLVGGRDPHVNGSVYKTTLS